MSAGAPVLPLCLGLALVLSGTGPARDPVRDLRSSEPERRLEALRALTADPSLAGGAPRDRLRGRLRTLLERERDPSARGLAARVLRAVGEPEDLLAVVERLSREEDDRAHPDLLEALDGVEDDAVVDAVVRIVGRKGDDRVRGLLTLALGRLGGDRALRALYRQAEKRRPWSVATSALIGLGRKRHPDVVALLVRRLRDEDPGVRAMALDSLGRLTGLRLGEEAGPWERWWEEAREGFRFSDPGRDAPAADGSPYGREPALLPRYYGIPIRGRRVCFCFDVSASMWGPPFEAAAAELVAAVKALPPSSRFSVVFFNEKVWTWRDEPAPGLPWPKEELFALLPTLETKSFTNIHDALETALGLAGRGRFARDPPPGVDDVFLVTDGEPNRGRFRDVRGIVTSITRLDTPRVARIHCIALGEKPRELLRQIAEENGGTFVDRAPR